MRVVMTAHPGWGHLHSMIPTARALEAEGHDVRLATAASLVPVLRQLGVSAVAAGVDWDVSEADRTFPGFLKARGVAQTRALARLAGRGMVDDLLRLADDFEPDVVIRDAYELGGLIAARRLGVPVVVHGITVRLPNAVMRRTAGAHVAELRARAQLPPDDEFRDADRDLWLSFLPPSFAPEDWPAADDELHLRPPLFDRSGDEGLPEWIDALERPLVYVTLGTVFNQRHELFLRIADALAGEDVDVVMTVGRNVDPATLGPLPANVHAARYIPQSLLLDRAAAVVTHGGFNTVMAALTFGVPVCCIPLSTDHPINAQRCVELGVGTACTTWTPVGGWPVARPEDVQPEAIRENVRTVLHDPSYRAAAQRLRDEIAALPGIDEAVRRIERLAAAPRELAS